MQAEFGLVQEQRNRFYCAESVNADSPFHFHSQIEIYFVDEGEMEVWVNDNRTVLHAGEMSVAFSYDAHGYKGADGSEAIYLIIPLDRCADVLPQISSKRLESPFINDEKTYKTVLAAAEGIIESKNEISKKGYIYTILGAVFEQMTDKEQTESHPRAFSAEMLIYISENFREELTLDALAREFGFNSSYLSRNFRETFGISFLKYLTMLRLREAVLLMRSGQKSVTECVYESGFGSMRSFYRAFREEFGCSPKEYFGG